MGRQYNFSSQQTSLDSHRSAAALAIDTGSPVVSVALSLDGEIAAQRSIELRRSSGQLLQMIDDVLAECGLQMAHLDLLVGLRGPGSFTGLRIGLATMMGIRMALGTPCVTFPTHQVLATLAPPARDGAVTACVDALRGAWLVQQFSSAPPYPALGPPENRTAESLVEEASSPLVGFGVSKLVGPGRSAIPSSLVEPGPLAPQALRILDDCPPDPRPELLAQPLYLQPPAVQPTDRQAS